MMQQQSRNQLGTMASQRDRDFPAGEPAQQIKAVQHLCGRALEVLSLAESILVSLARLVDENLPTQDGKGETPRMPSLVLLEEMLEATESRLLGAQSRLNQII